MFNVTDSVVLRPLQASDATAYYACARKNVRRLEPWFYWASDAMTPEETQQYLRAVEAQPQPALDRPYGYFDGEKMAGSIGLYKTICA
jgi:RimJ/RimL family protein N-acetyltransferase